MAVLISRTDLARKTREILEVVLRGQTVIVESYGQEQVVLLDALDYHILRAAARVALGEEEAGSEVAGIIHRYLDESISLSKAAELLGVSRFDLMERFERLTIPLRLGPPHTAAAREEVQSARQNS